MSYSSNLTKYNIGMYLINYKTNFRHIPKAKHTTVAETPELKRLAENTKLQSNVSFMLMYIISIK